MIIDLSPEGKGPQYLDSFPGLSLEDLVKQANEQIKNNPNGKS